MVNRFPDIIILADGKEPFSVLFIRPCGECHDRSMGADLMVMGTNVSGCRKTIHLRHLIVHEDQGVGVMIQNIHHPEEWKESPGGYVFAAHRDLQDSVGGAKEGNTSARMERGAGVGFYQL
jgi:hypothetical protein